MSLLAVKRLSTATFQQKLVGFGSERRHMAEITEPVAEPEPVPPRWELVECTCPDWCERDHEQD
jgi:hypothetical protein